MGVSWGSIRDIRSFASAHSLIGESRIEGVAKRMTILRIVKLGTSSLRNHIFFIFVVVSLPTAAVFAVSSYQDHELTPMWMLRIFVASTLAGLFVALVRWFIILSSHSSAFRAEA